MSTVMKKTSMAVVLECWGDQAPEWVTALAQECDKTSQAKVARRLHYSGSTINQVLAKKYVGRLDIVQKKVEGAYLHRTVDCPILGELALDACLDHQSKPFAATNAQRVMLYRACRGGCPHTQENES